MVEGFSESPEEGDLRDEDRPWIRVDQRVQVPSRNVEATGRIVPEREAIWGTLPLPPFNCLGR